MIIFISMNIILEYNTCYQSCPNGTIYNEEGHICLEGTIINTTIYEQQGNTGILSQISNIFYSTIISCFINIIIKKLGLSNDDMVKIKQIPNNKEELKQSILLMKKLKIKFSILFIISFLLVSFFLYFISAFCAVYKNTQNILIENTLSSFCLSLLYPFGLNLIPGLLRIPSLKNNSGCSKCIYFISKLIALI